jgi:hypothetical protein
VRRRTDAQRSPAEITLPHGDLYKPGDRVRVWDGVGTLYVVVAIRQRMTMVLRPARWYERLWVAALAAGERAVKAVRGWVRAV